MKNWQNYFGSIGCNYEGIETEILVHIDRRGIEVDKVLDFSFCYSIVLVEVFFLVNRLGFRVGNRHINLVWIEVLSLSVEVNKVHSKNKEDVVNV